MRQQDRQGKDRQHDHADHRPPPPAGQEDEAFLNRGIEAVVNADAVGRQDRRTPRARNMPASVTMKLGTRR